MKKLPMISKRLEGMPKIFNNVPSFLGVPILKEKSKLVDYDFVIYGVPWEGTITWGDISKCELATKTIRNASARYSSYLPEYNINFLEYLKFCDMGDINIFPGNEEKTMYSVYKNISEVIKFSKDISLIGIGGDHSWTPQVINAIKKHYSKIGILHLDSHLDNLPSFGNDKYSRCSTLHHINDIKEVKKSSIVHFGIRGPRNSVEQMEIQKKMGSHLFDMRKIRKDGLKKSVLNALDIVTNGTECFYVTICSDIIDAVYNPGGPCDFDGLTPSELFYIMRKVGYAGFKGMDFVEVYPFQDERDTSSHIVCWTIIHALCGRALFLKNR